jgi:hypothetical protein
VVERRNQMRGDLPLTATGAGAADGLAVDRDHPPTADHGRAGPHPRPDHTVQNIRVDTGERPPDRRLRRVGSRRRLLGQGAVNVYPFIQAEKAGRRNVTRASALLNVSPAAF